MAKATSTGRRVEREGARFSMVPEWLLAAEISDRALRLWAVLDRYAGSNGDAFPSRSTLAERLRCSVDSIDRAIAELEAVGALEVERAGTRVNVYRLLDRPRQLAARVRPTSRTGAASASRTGAARSERQLKESQQGETADAVASGRAPSTEMVSGRNLVFDAVREECGIAEKSPRLVEVATAINGTSKGGDLGIRDLAYAELGDSGVVGEGPAVEVAMANLVHERAAEYRRVMGGAILTPLALRKWWVDLPGMHSGANGSSPLDTARAVEDELRAMRGQ